jgi:hypothetical protein
MKSLLKDRLLEGEISGKYLQHKKDVLPLCGLPIRREGSKNILLGVCTLEPFKLDRKKQEIKCFHLEGLPLSKSNDLNIS